jgi:hypothetical protein
MTLVNTPARRVHLPRPPHLEFPVPLGRTA